MKRKTRTKMRPQMQTPELVKMELDNPDWAPWRDGLRAVPKKAPVQVNVRESAIATLYAKRQLDEAQVRAADKFRGLYEAAGGKGAPAIDYSKEPVDGGGYRESIGAVQLIAGTELKKCRDLLGEFPYQIIRQIAGERYSLHEICGSRRERETCADVLKIGLTQLAEKWGFASRSRY